MDEFYLVDVPGGDRRYIWHTMTDERKKALKAKVPGTRVFRISVRIPKQLYLSHGREPLDCKGQEV